MILTKQEVLDLAEHNMPMFSLKEAQFRICDFAEAIERAVLAKAGEQLPVAIKGCGAWDGLECLDELPDGLALYASPLPAQAIPEGSVTVSTDDLKRIHRDLDACQKVIWLAGGFDPAYCKDAQESLKLIDSALSAYPKP